jgi:Sporulation lipoprotein YhcN/YlaJ (Spore_YhcN_YlaJ)
VKIHPFLFAFLHIFDERVRVGCMEKTNLVKVLLISLSSFMILVSGCNNKKEEGRSNKDSPSPMSYIENKQSLSHEAKAIVLSMPEITDAKAVNSEDQIFLAVKPKHLERFQLTSLKKKIKKKIEKKYPKMEVTVSTDQKIFTLLGELESKLDKKMDSKDIERELKKIQKKSTDEA